MSRPIHAKSLSLLALCCFAATNLCLPHAFALDDAAADARLNDLAAHFNEENFASNESDAAIVFFKSTGEDGYTFLHRAYSGRLDGVHQKAALYVIFRVYPQHKKIYLEAPIHGSYGDDYGYSYLALKPFLAKLDTYVTAATQPKQPDASTRLLDERTKKIAMLGEAIAKNAKLGKEGLDATKKFLEDATATDRAENEVREAPEVRLVLASIRKHGNASLLDAAAKFLNDDRPAVAKAALNIFETHATKLGAKLDSNQECFVWWAIEGKKLVQLNK